MLRLLRMLLLHLLGLLLVPLFHLLLLLLVVISLLGLLMLLLLSLLELLVLLVLSVDQLLLLLLVFLIQLGIARVRPCYLVRLKLAGVSWGRLTRRRVFARTGGWWCMIRRTCLSCSHNTTTAEFSRPRRRSNYWPALVLRSAHSRIQSCSLSVLLLRGHRRNMPFPLDPFF